MRNILETIKRYDMIQPGRKVLAAVSGGADSVCLLMALLEFRKECPFEIAVVHVEHGIRGEESQKDAAFVEELCKKYQVACTVEHGDALAESREKGISVEEAARSLRYRVFEQVRERLGADVVAVAHNENDQAETVLWNLARGSGLRGLGGIRPVRGRIIRPLLFTPRKRVEEILREMGLCWRTDGTNLSTQYTRNRIRLEALPYFEQYLNPRAVEHIARAAGQLREAQDFVEALVEKAAGRCIGRDGEDVFLRLEPFEQEERYLQGELLKECIRRCLGESGAKDFGQVHIGMLRELAKLPCGKSQDLPQGIRASRRDGRIFFEKKCRAGRGGKVTSAAVGAGDGQGQFPEDGFRIFPGCRLPVGDMVVAARVFLREKLPETWPDEILSEKKYTKWLSCDTIKSNVCCRKRKSGDYLVVNAQGGRKKLKDYMIDCKIPREERDRLWIFADGSHVLWVPGYRISEAAKVTRETKEILELSVTKG